jgi:hypothetical protein
MATGGRRVQQKTPGVSTNEITRPASDPSCSTLGKLRFDRKAVRVASVSACRLRALIPVLDRIGKFSHAASAMLARIWKFRAHSHVQRHAWQSVAIVTARKITARFCPRLEGPFRASRGIQNDVFHFSGTVFPNVLQRVVRIREMLLCPQRPKQINSWLLESHLSTGNFRPAPRSSRRFSF